MTLAGKKQSLFLDLSEQPIEIISKIIGTNWRGLHPLKWLVGRVVLALMVSLGSVNAQDDSFPQIVGYSKPFITVREGTLLSLQLDLNENRGVQVTWTSEKGETLCEKQACLINTSGFGVGLHKINVLAQKSNRWASIIYEITILPRSSNLKVTTHTPPLWNKQEEIVYHHADDAAVKLLKGRAYAFSAKKAKSVGKGLLPLPWNSRLLVAKDSLLTFSESGSFQGYLFSNSQAVIHSQGKVRFVVLEKGLLRLQGFGDSRHVPWVLIDSSLQLLGKAHSDFLVILHGPMDTHERTVEICIIKGAVALTYKQNDASSKTHAGSEFITKTLLQGDFFKIPIKRPKESRFFHDFSNRVEDPILESSPSLAIEFRARDLDSSEALSKKPSVLSKRLKSHLKKARANLIEADYAGALGALNSQSSTLPRDFDFAMTAGQASKGLFLYKQAQNCFNLALELQPSSDLALSEMGRSFFLMGQDQKALEFFLQADLSKSHRPKWDHYYLGVLQFQNNQLEKARSAFHYSLWASPQLAALDQSSEDFLAAIREQKVFFASVHLWAFRDSNPLSMPSKGYSDLGDDLSWRNGCMLKCELSRLLFARYGIRGLLALQSLVMTYDQFPSGEYLKQDLNLNLRYRHEGMSFGTHQLNYSFGIKPFMSLMTIASKRAYDALGTLWTLEANSLGFTCGLRFIDAMYLDPQPSQLKTYDPYHREATSSLDLSFRKTSWSVLVGKTLLSSLELQATYGRDTYMHRYDGSLERSYHSDKVSASIVYFWQHRWRAALRLLYDKRNPITSSGTGSRLYQHVSSEIRRFWLPQLSFNLKVASESSSSSWDGNEAHSPHKRLVFMMGTTSML